MNIRHPPVKGEAFAPPAPRGSCVQGCMRASRAQGGRGWQMRLQFGPGSAPGALTVPAPRLPQLGFCLPAVGIDPRDGANREVSVLVRAGPLVLPASGSTRWRRPGIDFGPGDQDEAVAGAGPRHRDHRLRTGPIGRLEPQDTRDAVRVATGLGVLPAGPRVDPGAAEPPGGIRILNRGACHRTGEGGAIGRTANCRARIAMGDHTVRRRSSPEGTAVYDGTRGKAGQPEPRMRERECMPRTSAAACRRVSQPPNLQLRRLGEACACPLRLGQLPWWCLVGSDRWPAP